MTLVIKERKKNKRNYIEMELSSKTPSAKMNLFDTIIQKGPSSYIVALLVIKLTSQKSMNYSPISKRIQQTNEGWY